MDILACLLIIASLYCVLYFFDTFFRTCAHYPYIQFLRGTGLEIKFLQVRWRSTAFNRMFLRWGTGHTKFFSIWFTIGLYVTLIALPVSILLLLATVFQCFFSSSSVTGGYLIEPVIPGINFPASELGYYSATLIVCSIIHEAGHALASVKEDVHVTDVGVNVLLILPVAFVSLSSEDLQRLKPWKSLKIFCAGVWHNIVLSLIAYLLCLSLPTVFSSVFSVGGGVTVNHVTKFSPLLGPNGLSLGDTVIRINDCAVKDVNTWNECLHKARFDKPGFCVSSSLVHALDESVPLRHNVNGNFECCNSDKTGSACFEYIVNNDGVLEIPPHVCLPIRPVVEKATEFCNGSSEPCKNNLHCVRPLLYNNTNLFKISCGNKDVIYLGYSGDLLYTLSVSSYIPKYVFASTRFPDVVEKICKYVAVLSLGLAVVNVLPCLAMDGHFISNSIVDLLLSKRIKSDQTLQFISLIIPLCGTVLIASLILCTIWTNLTF